jgi:hypothetical protein
MKKLPHNRMFFRQLIGSVSLCLFITFFFTACDSNKSTEKKGKSLGFDPERWLAIENPSLGFKGKFPGKWKSDVKFMQTQGGAATVYIFEYWHVAFQYGITIVRFPPGVADNSNPQKVLKYAVKSLADERGGLISYQEPITIAGCPARRAVLTLPDSRLKNSRVNTIIILRDDLVYRVTTAGLGNVEYVDFFLKSFELIPIAG